MAETDMRMEGAFLTWTSSRQAHHTKERWKYNWKHTQDVLHKIIYFSFRMILQTYVQDSSLGVQVQSQSHDNIRARPKSYTDMIHGLVYNKTGVRNTDGGALGTLQARLPRETRRVLLENQFLQYSETWIHTIPLSSFCGPVHWLTSHNGAHACNLNRSNVAQVCVCSQRQCF